MNGALAITPQNVDNEAKDKCNLDVDNQKLKPTANWRILGVNIDDKLRFTEHISDICKNVSKKIGVLARLRNLISGGKTKLQLYLTAILPHLTYCQTVWHFCKQSERRKLERLQESTLRIIYYCRADSYEDLPRRAKLPSLYNRRLIETYCWLLIVSIDTITCGRQIVLFFQETVVVVDMWNTIINLIIKSPIFH